MRIRAVFMLALCAVFAASAAETPAERGKRVVDEALQALGGEAFLKVDTVVESGRAYSFFRSELSGLAVAKFYTQYLPAPNPPTPGKLLVRERESFGKKEENEGAVLFTETGGWEITWRGARPIESQRFQNYRDFTLRNIFYLLRCRLNEPGLSFYSQGADTYERQPVEIVDITDADNNTVTVYFSQRDKLPVRQSYKRRNPEYKDFDTEVTVFGKYRDAGGGVKWPLDTRRERNGDKIYEMYAETVQVNQPLAESLFALPAAKTAPKK